MELVIQNPEQAAGKNQSFMASEFYLVLRNVLKFEKYILVKDLEPIPTYLHGMLACLDLTQYKLWAQPGSSLENPEPRTRARGIQLLSQVLLQCHSLLLEKEVVHLILFYENRLKDHHLVIPSVLQGLKALSLCVALPPGLAVSVLKAIFQEVHVQVMDGEKDPRNLLVAFRIVHDLISRDYSLGTLW
ncbi:mms19 nucleotide excision repair [Saguinus oedipus]|uniref:MMS19 nucleotide excision repair protein n=1 Tax=Saguinus oedipus TaxID=9490 RepID=A0ABQ9UNU9_SAGOE|nr:mms19 nucleotide excision repair [Saguinus oedipus]